MIEIHPKICNLCGGRGEYMNNARIYGKQYGSGYCYRCTVCGAYVGTHKPRPKEAMGILADSEMREWKRKCHNLFDSFWKAAGKRKQRRRRQLYIRLAGEMGIRIEECHFGYFDREQLRCAYRIIEGWKKHPPEDMPYEVASEPCLNCFRADWTDLYGVMVYACDMSHCIKAEEDYE